MATRVLWKGAISFGLVHIPVGLHTATSQQGIDFDWLDKRTLDPVGYKRVNKRTGKEITSDNIVKGVQTGDGEYVVVSKEEIEAAFPKTTQTIEIERFVAARDIPFSYLERPYYLAPINKGAKVYALLREALLETGRVGVARVVINTRQHLAVLVPSGPALILNLLRWGGDIKSFEALKLPPAGAKAAGLKEGELKMARQLIEEMSSPWDADDFRDYMLSFLFLRYLSGNYEVAAQRELGADYPKLEGDSRRVPLALWYANNPDDVVEFEQQMRRKVHYVIKPEYL